MTYVSLDIKDLNKTRFNTSVGNKFNSILYYLDNALSSQEDCDTDFSYSKDIMSFLDDEINSLRSMESLLENLCKSSDFKTDNSKISEQSSRRKKMAVSNFVTIDLINNKPESIVNKGRTYSTRK